MSFKQNDTNNHNMIHLGNYEEFFILYMDNELNEDQMKMVDAFLSEHPDLQGEFELLMNTRLPMEDFNFSKNELMADRMRLNTVDDELLLFIDNELPAEQNKVVELELQSNKDYQLQHELLMRTKLDPSEKLVHPNKKELYRKDERRIVAFRPWMRVAAAAVVIAIAGVMYFTGSKGTIENSTALNDQLKLKDQTENKASDFSRPKIENRNTQTSNGNNDLALPKHGEQNKKPVVDQKPDLPGDIIKNIAVVDRQNREILDNSDDPVELKNKTTIIENNTYSDVAVAKPDVRTPSQIINNSAVTSAIANRNTSVDVAAKENESVASKGSVKGFLRKTTRLIEKRTGIDPTSNGELLIGAVAINLN